MRVIRPAVTTHVSDAPVRRPPPESAVIDAGDIAASARGDVGAFERLYRRYHDRIHRLASRMVGQTEADDATQDIFFRIWTRAHTFRGDASFATWLHRVAMTTLMRRAAGNRMRAQRHVPLGDEVLTVRSTLPDVGLDVDALLSKLSPDLRAAVILHDIEGYSHEEIGAMLDISLTAARMRLYRARQELRAFLREERR